MARYSSYQAPPRRLRTLNLVVAALMLLPLLTAAGVSPGSPAQAAAPTAVNTHMQYGFVMALLENNVAVKNMGFQWVQYGVYWKDTEPSRGNFNWANVDNIVNGARNAGVNLLIRVSRPPAWARDAQCVGDDTCPPRDPADFARFAARLAAYVKPRIAPYNVAYEILNEPNTSLEWGGLFPDPERYTAILAALYPQMKAADPGATILAGAVTTVGQRLSPPFIDDVEYLRRMYAAGAAPFFDAISDHPYGFASAPEEDPIHGPSGLVFRRAELHRQVMVTYGDSAKQIWATELGWALDPRTVGSSCGQPDWFYIFNP
ncbi:MAG TPA: cellulase family glycosylhydrolase, partial [Chloroflexia bacterium]|nr:cellulase family glycosylhydrolase [Chloroflexia bacterium]